MAENKTTIIALLRNVLGDNIKNGLDIFTYTTNPNFTLSEPNAQAVSSVCVNDSISGVTYSYDSSLQKVIVTSPLLIDDVVEVNYTYYSNYSDNELTGYLKHALALISVNRYADFEIDATDGVTIYPIPSKSEGNLIATVAAIIINPENKSYKTPDFSVTMKNEMSTSDMISKTIGIFKKNSSGMYAII
jgi:hypothetical protein